jgi:uncharacterized membrane protein (DUF485 family)
VANPLRSEAAAFRFLWLTIAYFALIALAAWINRWLGVVVFLLLTAAAIYLSVGRRLRR